ncbi:MAG TPA: hypothetical protein PKC83_11095 [Gemmatimonadaceae bacterium]|nr:hypothetical protein [Gemmatimonadaceae bacterium]
MSLSLVPVTLEEANDFVAQHHRHHPPVVGHKFSVGVADEGDRLCGVVIVGRPVSQRLDDGATLEVTRCCTDGTRNAASMLYGAAQRASFALGYRRLVTYTLVTEPGTSLRAAGWKVVGETPGRSWSRPSRPRTDKHTLMPRLRWEVA